MWPAELQKLPAAGGSDDAVQELLVDFASAALACAGLAGRPGCTSPWFDTGSGGLVVRDWVACLGRWGGTPSGACKQICWAHRPVRAVQLGMATHRRRRPGLVYIDVKVGRIPDRRGWRVHR